MVKDINSKRFTSRLRHLSISGLENFLRQDAVKAIRYLERHLPLVAITVTTQSNRPSWVTVPEQTVGY